MNLCCCIGVRCFDCCLESNDGCTPCCAPAFAINPPVARLAQRPTDAAFVPSSTNSSLAAKDLYLVNHCCCVQQAAFIPGTFGEGFGYEEDSLCCCLQSHVKGFQLPADPSGYELCLLWSGQIKCVAPSYKCRGRTRLFFAFAKFAFPPNDEVPCAMVVCTKKVCGPQSIEAGKNFSFPKISLKAPEKSDLERA